VEKYAGNDWRLHRVFNTRRYNRIPLDYLKNSEIEFVIITWKKGQSAPLHNHPEHGCIVKILQGNLTEFLYDFKRELKNVKHCGVNSVTYMDDTIGLHEVVATEDTVSLHIYSPPNYTPAFFR
jgi:cysteine dioxygenase